MSSSATAEKKLLVNTANDKKVIAWKRLYRSACHAMTFMVFVNVLLKDAFWLEELYVVAFEFGEQEVGKA